MKKTLIAIAALAATGAFAQSSVTISGQMDAGFASTTSRGTATTAGVTTRGSNAGIHGASRLRFVGVEDMGGGNKATFWLEMQPSLTDGSISAAGLFNRGAWLGLQGGWGELRLGRQGTNTIGLVCAVDGHGCYSGFSGGGILFNGNTTPGNSGAAWIAANPTRGAAFGTAAATAAASSTAGDATRYVRAIRYSLPTLVKGLSVNATSAYGTANTTSGATAGGTIGVDATYSAGPLMAGLAIQRAGAEATANSAEGSLTTFGGSYNLGVVKLGAIYQTEKATATGTTVLAFDSAKAYALTAIAAPISGFSPYVKLGNRSASLGSGASATTAKVMNIGTRYALSKTTNLYADYVRNSVENTVLGVGATGLQPKQLSAGMQVTF